MQNSKAEQKYQNIFSTYFYAIFKILYFFSEKKDCYLVVEIQYKMSEAPINHDSSVWLKYTNFKQHFSNRGL